MTSIGRVNGIAAVLVLVGTSFTMIGCGGGTPPPETASTANSTAAAGDRTPDEEEQALLEHHQHHHHGGVTLLIALSIDTLGVTPEQKAQVEQIRKDLHTAMDPAHVAEVALVNTLADGIQNGGIAKDNANAALAKLADASAQVHAASADALNRLHAALTPEQRVALADKVEAHWAVWQSANSEKKTEPGKPMVQHAKLVKEVGLTPEQVDKIHANLAAEPPPPAFEPKDVDAYVHAFGDAFKRDTFDAKTLTTGGPANASVSVHGATRMVRYYEAVDPVLTGEQRARMAKILREHASYDSSKGEE